MDDKVLASSYMASNPYSAYLESQVLSASPLQLVVLAYEGAIDAVRSARTHLLNKQIFERSRSITKAQCILTELQKSLDHNHGGDLAGQLDRLYRYMHGRLREANFRQMEEPLAEVEKLLGTLAGSWRQIASAEDSANASLTNSAWLNETDAQVFAGATLTL